MTGLGGAFWERRVKTKKASSGKEKIVFFAQCETMGKSSIWVPEEKRRADNQEKIFNPSNKKAKTRGKDKNQGEK